MKRSAPPATLEDRAMAAKRLQTWVPQVDPDDASHVDAYLLAKMQNKQRVSLQAVLANIKQQEHKVERSLSQGALFWVAAAGLHRTPARQPQPLLLRLCCSAV